jgi:hypothetical protein
LYRLNFSSQVITGISSDKAWAMMTVERVRVQERQTEKKECMVRGVRQYSKVQVLKRVARTAFHPGW